MEDSSESEEEDDGDDDNEDNEQQNKAIEHSTKGRFCRFADELGRGAYKIVSKGLDKETGREIAWNAINLQMLPKNDRLRIRQEMDLIKSLKHPNIIHFVGGF